MTPTTTATEDSDRSSLRQARPPLRLDEVFEDVPSGSYLALVEQRVVSLNASVGVTEEIAAVGIGDEIISGSAV